MTTYMQYKLKERNQNLNTKKQGRGGWDDPTLAIPRKRMRIVIKGAKKHVRMRALCTNGGGYFRQT